MAGVNLVFVDGAEGHFLCATDHDPERRVAVRESGVLGESGQDGRFHGEELPKILWDNNRKTFYFEGRRKTLNVTSN